MNSTNLTLTNQAQPENQDVSSIYQIIEYINEILVGYGNMSIGFLGFTINIIFLFVYSNKTLKGLYSFQWCHGFANVVVCLLVGVHLGVFESKKEANYYELIIRSLIIPFSLKIALIASGFSDVLRIYNRYSDLTRKKSILSGMSKLANLAICFGLGIIFCLPLYFGIKIEQVKIEKSQIEELYFWNSNEFLSSNYFVIYLIEPLTPLIILTILNILSVKRYHEDTRERPQSGMTGKKKAELQFTKTVLMLNVMWILARSFEVTGWLLYCLVATETLKISPESKILIKAFRDISFSILIAAHVFEPFIYLIMDQNIKRVVLKIFKRD